MTFECEALLFDLDGTLIDSTPSVDRAWTAWCHRHSLDPTVVIPQIHGRRSIDSIRLVAPHLDAELEDAWLRKRESEDTEGVVALPGVTTILAALDPNCWALVTSGTFEVATARLRAAGIPESKVRVFGDEVARGKPDPDPFLLGAARLGVSPGDCVVFEDTRAGLLAGRSAGCRTVGVRAVPGENLIGFSDANLTDYTQLSVQKKNPLLIEVHPLAIHGPG